VKVKGRWIYLYGAFGSEGSTVNFYLSKTGDYKVAKYLFKKASRSFYISRPCVITVDKNPIHLMVIEELKKGKKMPVGIQIRQIKYLNNIVEQNHCFIKKRVCPMLELKSFLTAKSILPGIEAMHTIKKEQFALLDRSVQNQVKFLRQLFGLPV